MVLPRRSHRVICFLGVFFFFSSRRRHTRWPRDWSSDVCSSDLTAVVLLSGSTSALTLESTAAAVTAQSRSADRIVAIAPSSLEAEAGALLEDLLERGDVDEVLTTSGAVGRAGAVREALDLLDRRPAASGPQRSEER